MGDVGTLDIFGFFINNFHVSDIYKFGWYAAQEWTALVAGILIALATSIRWLEESAKGLSTGKSNQLHGLVSAVGYAVLIGVYFTLAMLIIDLFNAIHNALGSSTNMALLGTKLDSTYSAITNGEYEFAWADIIDSGIFLFAFFVYAITYGVLIFVTVAMRIGHAILVTFILFWGAVALPMSITNGLKMMGSFKTMSITVFVWPIVEAFFIYLIASSFLLGLDRSGLGDNSGGTFNLGTLVYYTAIFSIMNMILIATTISAPMIAQAVANGTGNITGMVGSFAAAGIAAGAMVGKMGSMKAQQSLKGGLNMARGGANDLGGKLMENKNPAQYFSPNKQAPTSNMDKHFADKQISDTVKDMNGPKMSEGYSGLNEGSHSSSNSNQSKSSASGIENKIDMGQDKKTEQSSGYSFESKAKSSQAEKLNVSNSTSNSTPNSGKANTDQPIKSSVNLGGSGKSIAGSEANLDKPKMSGDMTTEQQISQQEKELETPEGQDNEQSQQDTNRKKMNQQKRGAIINQNKGKK